MTISFDWSVLRLWYFTWLLLVKLSVVIRPFHGYQQLWPCDLVLMFDQLIEDFNHSYIFWMIFTKILVSHMIVPCDKTFQWVPKIWLCDWLIGYLLFCVPLKNISHIWRRHHYRWRAVRFRPMLGAQGLWAGRDLYRATPAATLDLGFSGLIWRTALFCCLLRHTKGCGGSILTRILTGPLSVTSYNTQWDVEAYSNLNPHGWTLWPWH
jgi:hypothetical protein